MPARAAAPVGAPVRNDLTTPDVDASVAFYTRLFRWTYRAGTGAGDRADGAPPGGLLTRHGRTIAAVRPPRAGTEPPGWTVSLRTDDMAATLDATRRAGGRVLVEAAPEPGTGTLAVVADPGGAAVGFWQPGPTAGTGGFEVADEPGAPVWHELSTKDYAGAVAFYREVARWSTEVVGDTDEFRYTVHQVGDTEYAGIMDASCRLGEGEGPHWNVYLGARDTDTLVDRAVDLGASVVRAPRDTPYGRVATVADPTGATFKVVSVPASATVHHLTGTTAPFA